MKYRAALLAGLTAVGTLAATSHGAANVCFLVQDETGDGTSTFIGDPVTAPNDPAWDIVSADVASDGKVVTVVVRVDKLAKSASTSPTGLHWRVDFDVAGGSSRVFASGRTSPFGDNFAAGYIDPVTGSSASYAAGTATGLIDVDKNEVRVHVPTAAFAAQAAMKKGTKISGITATAGRYINTAGGNPSLSDFSDSAEGSKTYTIGDASCVNPGK